MFGQNWKTESREASNLSGLVNLRADLDSVAIQFIGRHALWNPVGGEQVSPSFPLDDIISGP